MVLAEIEQSQAKMEIVFLLVGQQDRVLQQLVVDGGISLAETVQQFEAIDAVHGRCGLPARHDSVCQETDESSAVGWKLQEHTVGLELSC